MFDQAHICAALRYLVRTLYRAWICARASVTPWSSARAHCGLAIDTLLSSDWTATAPVTNWSSWLAGDSDLQREQRIRERTYMGRPCGDEDFVKKIEATVGRPLAPGKRGPKPDTTQTETQRVLWPIDEIES